MYVLTQLHRLNLRLVNDTCLVKNATKQSFLPIACSVVVLNDSVGLQTATTPLLITQMRPRL